MSIIKSFSVGNGDMFYIEHGSDNFSIIDCNLDSEQKEEIMDEICKIGGSKGIMRLFLLTLMKIIFMGLSFLMKDSIFTIFTVLKMKLRKQMTQNLSNIIAV